MKKTLILLAAALIAHTSMAQKKYEFTDTKRLYCADVQDQGRSGTCWCFSTMSFLESEMKANGAEEIPNLSEMFVVRQCYLIKAQKYVYMHGKTNFAQGGFFYDNVYVMKNYGLMPESAFPNIKGEGSHTINHNSYESNQHNYLDSVADDNKKIINPKWLKEFSKRTDEFFGENPNEFEYNGKKYTPRSFADEVVKLNPDDYVQVTSFSHHPFYQNCILELPDNWMWSEFFNVKVEDLITIIDKSIEAGHTVLWAADVSEEGFDQARGYAVLPGINPSGMSKKDIEAYKAKTPDQQKLISRRLSSPGIEMNVTQESRQADFDSRRTTDDHGMQIIGTAKDQEGNKFYIVKNSWGNYNKFDGFFYASEAYIKAKTTGLMVNKNVCKDILERR